MSEIVDFAVETGILKVSEISLNETPHSRAHSIFARSIGVKSFPRRLLAFTSCRGRRGVAINRMKERVECDAVRVIYKKRASGRELVARNCRLQCYSPQIGKVCEQANPYPAILMSTAGPLHS